VQLTAATPVAACSSDRPSAAAIVPSRLTQIVTAIDEPEVGPVARRTSSRRMTSLTGSPDFFAGIAHTDSTWIAVLPPIAPPLSAG